ncbi:MAG: general secretion pathway protein GspK [Verrucomicrobia bacterium]|nr:general secretion pathway protein GspK [Verrucomicrobiota bacterium]
MIAIIVLSVMAAILAYSMRVEARLSMNVNNNPQLVWMGRSGVQLDCWLIAQEARLPYTSLNEYCFGGPGAPDETNGPLAALAPGQPQNLAHYQLGSNSWVSIQNIDQERLFNVNVASASQIQAVLNLMGVDAGAAAIVSDSILDWVNQGDDPRISGAKNDYYQNLNPPYNCKEAPMDNISELLLVRGITEHPNIYFGGMDSNSTAPVFHHQLGFGGPPGAEDYPFGLKNVFTPFSNGHVNVNTAGLNVLAIVLGGDTNIAAAVMQLRAGPDLQDGTADDQPFKNVSQLQMAGVAPQVMGALAQFCTIKSTTYEATVVAHLGDVSRVFKAILVLSGNSVNVYNFYEEN